MSVLYLSYDGLLDPLGQSQILPYLRGLAVDYKIILITFEKRSFTKQEIQNQQEAINNLNIQWIPLSYHKSPPVLSTIWDLIILWQTSKRLINAEPITLVHCRSYVTSLVGLRLKRKYSIPFLFDMRGFWADERVEGGLWNIHNPLYRLIFNFFKRKEKEFIQRADGVVVLTSEAKDEISKWSNPKNVSIIPCCVDLQLFDPDRYDPLRKSELRKSLGIEQETYVVVYLGSMGTWYLTEEMIAFYKLLKRDRPHAKLLLLSPDRLQDSDLANEIIQRRVSRDEVPAFLSIAQASVFFIKTSFSKKGSSATRMAELLAMNVPLVTNKGWGDVAHILQSGEGGIIMDDFQMVSMQLAVNKLLNFPQGTGRLLAENYFSLTRGIQDYRDLYAKISKPA